MKIYNKIFKVCIIMKKFNKITFASAALSAALLSPVMAVDSSSIYVKGAAGIGFNQKISGDYYKDWGAKKSKSPIFMIGGGYKFNDNLRADLNLGFLTNVKVNAKYGAATQKNKSMFVLANGYYDIGEYNGFIPYGTLGVGLANNKSGDMFFDNTFKGDVGVDKGKVSKKATSFAWNVGAGVQYSIAPEVKLDLGYRYMDLGKLKMKNGKDTVGYKLRTHAVTLGVSYHF